MKDIIALREKLNLLEQEVKTLTERAGRLAGKLDASLSETADLKLEIKGLKLFLGRVYPDFKGQFLEILEKVED